MAVFQIDNSKLKPYGVVLLSFDVVTTNSSGKDVLGYTDIVDTDTTRGVYALLSQPNTTMFGFNNALYIGNDRTSLKGTSDTNQVFISSNKVWIANNLSKNVPYLENSNSAPTKEDYLLNVTLHSVSDVSTYLKNGTNNINKSYTTMFPFTMWFGNIKKNDTYSQQEKTANTTYNKVTYTVVRDCSILMNNYRLNNSIISVEYWYNHEDEKPPVEQKISFTLNNCSVDYSDNVIGLGKHTFNFTARTGYIFSNVGHLTYTDLTDNSTKSIEITPNDTETNSITFTVTETTANININLTASVKPISKQNITFNLTNCTVDYSQSTIEYGKHTFTFTANNGYTFKENGRIEYENSSTGVNVSNTIPANNEPTLTFTFEVNNFTQNINITLKGIIDKETTTRFTNLYNTTDIELNNLSHERIFENTTSGVPQLFDYGSFINTLYKIPFNIDDNNLGDYDNIVLGTKQSQTRSTSIINNNLIVDIGDIEIPETYNSSLDYLNTTINLFLPVVNMITLNAYDVINNVINISYNINLYNGICTITVTNRNNVIYFGNQNIATKIPFMQNPNETVSSTTDFPFINDITRAYIVIDRPKPIISTSYNTKEQGQLKNYTGNVAIDDIELSCKATTREYNTIINLLKNGVKIK